MVEGTVAIEIPISTKETTTSRRCIDQRRIAIVLEERIGISYLEEKRRIYRTGPAQWAELMDLPKRFRVWAENSKFESGLDK